jgi:hypothetical protein
MHEKILVGGGKHIARINWRVIHFTYNALPYCGTVTASG